MQPPKNSGSPEQRYHLRISLGKEMIGWRKYKPLLSAIGEKALIAILLVVCIPFLPIIGSVYLIHMYKEYRHKVAVRNGILPSELSASQKTTVYLSSRDVSGILGRTDIEYSQSAERASFNYGGGTGRYRVYGTREEGLFMLVLGHSKIDPEKFKNGAYYRCEVVRVKGGYNHGDFGERSPMGSNDCVVLISKRVSKIPPSKNFVVIRGSDATQKQTVPKKSQSGDDEDKGGPKLKG